MAHRAATRPAGTRGAAHKNRALQRWLKTAGRRPDDRGEQWWREFDGLLRPARTRLHPTSAGVARFVLDTYVVSFSRLTAAS